MCESNFWCLFVCDGSRLFLSTHNFSYRFSWTSIVEQWSSNTIQYNWNNSMRLLLKVLSRLPQIWQNQHHGCWHTNKRNVVIKNKHAHTRAHMCSIDKVISLFQVHQNSSYAISHIAHCRTVWVYGCFIFVVYSALRFLPRLLHRLHIYACTKHANLIV